MSAVLYLDSLIFHCGVKGCYSSVAPGNAK